MPMTKSILRYPGGKTQLAKYISYLINLNKLKESIYCEPFSGGAGVSLELLLTNKVNTVILNDLDPSIYSIWYAVINETEKLIESIQRIPITIDEWLFQKDVYNRLNNIPQYNFELALSTLFLNRTNRGGIISAGPIGGYEQKSIYKLSCRFNKDKIIEKISKIANEKKRIRLYRLDANELIRNVLLYEDRNQLFTYFDPPYYHPGQALYKNAFIHNDHIFLENSIQLMNDYKWIATYDECNEIKQIYSKYRMYTYSIRYSVNNVRNANEYIFASDTTKIKSYDKVKLKKSRI